MSEECKRQDDQFNQISCTQAYCETPCAASCAGLCTTQEDTCHFSLPALAHFYILKSCHKWERVRGSLEVFNKLGVGLNGLILARWKPSWIHGQTNQGFLFARLLVCLFCVLLAAFEFVPISAEVEFEQCSNDFEQTEGNYCHQQVWLLESKWTQDIRASA